MQFTSVFFLECHGIEFTGIAKIFDILTILDTLICAHTWLDFTFVDVVSVCNILEYFHFIAFNLASLITHGLVWVGHFWCLKLAHCHYFVVWDWWLFRAKLRSGYIIHTLDLWFLIRLILSCSSLLLKSWHSGLHANRTSRRSLFLEYLLRIPISLTFLKHYHLCISIFISFFSVSWIGEFANFASPFWIICTNLLSTSNLTRTSNYYFFTGSANWWLFHIVINNCVFWTQDNQVWRFDCILATKSPNNFSHTWHSCVFWSLASLCNHYLGVIFLYMISTDTTSIKFTRIHSNLRSRALSNTVIENMSCQNKDVNKEVSRTLGKINKLNQKLYSI